MDITDGVSRVSRDANWPWPRPLNTTANFCWARSAPSGALWQEMYRSQYFEGGRVLTAAISAIDIALYDIMGKALDVPVYQLLGGKQRDRIPCFATTGAGTAEGLVAKCKELVELDWNVIRVAVRPVSSMMIRAFTSRAKRLGLRRRGSRNCARNWARIPCWASITTIA